MKTIAYDPGFYESLQTVIANNQGLAMIIAAGFLALFIKAID